MALLKLVGLVASNHAGYITLHYITLDSWQYNYAESPEWHSLIYYTPKLIQSLGSKLNKQMSEKYLTSSPVILTSWNNHLL